MRILIIANGITGEKVGLSGGDVRFLEIAKYWEKMGCEIHILSSESVIEICKNYKLNAKIHIIPGTRSSERFAYIIRTFQTLFFFPKSLKNFREGVVYSVNDSLFDVIPAVKLKVRYKSIKWVAVVHWLPPFPPWKRKKASLINSFLFFINERLSIWLANWFSDKILAVSETTGIQLKEANIDMEKVRVVKCGVNVTLAREVSKRIKDKKYDAVFMKRVQLVKGVYDLVDIWEEVVKVKKDAKLCIAGGDGKDEEDVKAYVFKKGLKDNIDFVGYIFDIEKKYETLANGKVFLLPSYEENWAIVIGECMAVGTPVIAYKLKELVHVWKEHVIWIPLGEIKTFSENIIKLLNDSILVSNIIKDNFQFIEEYDWENIAKDEYKIVTDIR